MAKRADTRLRKAINFDIDTTSLRSLFGESGRSGAYSRIRVFLGNKGFEHHQGSGYVSVKPLNYVEVYDILDDLTRTLPWLAECVRSFYVTNFVEQSDCSAYIKAILDVDADIEPPNFTHD
jgi:virulence-associated protein VapD